MIGMMIRTTIIGLCVMVMVQHLICQDIHFPVDDESYTHVSGGQPVTERKPLKVPGRCPENMLLYPDDGPKSAWVCDCKPHYIYFPQNDSCHEAFFRGPCPEHHFVYLAPNETIPTCKKNVCMYEGLVYYRGVCHTLRSRGGPCGENGTLSVNEITFQLECFDANTVPFYIIDPPQRACPKGSRRTSLGVCKKML